MRSIGAVISPCGSTRTCSPRSSGPRSPRCADLDVTRRRLSRLRTIFRHLGAGKSAMIGRPAVLSFAVLAIAAGVHAGASPLPPIGAMTMTTERTLAPTPPTAPALDAPLIGSAATVVQSAAVDTSIRPFQYHASDGQLADLERRILATRWPEKETVSDSSQGVPLATMQALDSYPQFVTNIDGLDIHFIHVKSKEKNALPVVISHGWPGSIIEQLKIIDPLTDPVAHGGKAEDAFDVVIPSMPGYGFSGKPTAPGWGVEHMAKAWDVLMMRLGYRHYVAQGGDWGAFVVDNMGIQAPLG